MMIQKEIIPFNKIIDVIVGERIDQKVFPSQLMAISVHLDSIKDIEHIQEKTDELYFLLLGMLQHPHADISRQIFLYLLRATPYVKNTTKLLDYISSNIRLLLKDDYRKYVSLFISLLKVLMNTSKQQVLEIVSDNFCPLFNLSEALEDKVIGLPIKNFIVFMCKNSTNFKQLFFSHVKQLSENLRSPDDCYKFLEFVDEFVSEFDVDELISCESISNLHTVLYNCVQCILFESNDELLQCALCNFFASKVGVDVNFVEHFLPKKPIIQDMLRLIGESTFNKPFDRELLRLLCYMCKIKGATFMQSNKIENIFLQVYNREDITPTSMGCIARCYLECLSNYDIFMLLTSNTISTDIKLMNESMLAHIYTIIDSQCNGVSYIPVLNRMISFFSNHTYIQDVDKRPDFHDFVIRKHNFFNRFVEHRCNYIVKSSFEGLDSIIQKVGLEFVEALLNFTWGFAAMIDSSNLLAYLLENKIGLNFECQELKRKIYKIIANNNTFLSVVDASAKNQLILIYKNQIPPKSIPQVATSLK